MNKQDREKSEVKASQTPLDVQALMKRVRSLLGQAGVDQPLSLGVLVQRTGILQGEIIKWKNAGILTPTISHKGNRTVDKYPAAEVEKALLARELSILGWRPKQILGAVPFWGTQEIDAGPTPQAELDQISRAVTLLKARLLALLAKMTAQLSNVPKNCVLVAYPLMTKEEIPAPNKLNWEEMERSRVEALIEQRIFITGISSEVGEVHFHFRDPQMLLQQVKKSNFLAIRVHGNQPTQVFGLIYGYIDGDPQYINLRQKLASQSQNDEYLFPKNEDWNLLLFLFDILCKKVDQVQSELESFSAPMTSTANALVNLIPLLCRDKWDFAGFLVPMNNQSLKVLFSSPSYPVSLRDHLYALHWNNNSLIPSIGWVFNQKDYLTIENISPSDPRLSEVSSEGIHALAMLSAIIDESSLGIVVVGSHHKLPEGVNYFEEAEIRFLYILSRIIAEAYKREQLSRPEAILLNLPEPPPPVQNEESLNSAIKTIVDKMIPLARANLGMDNSVVLLAVRLEGYGRLNSISPVASEWISTQLRRTFHQLLMQINNDDWTSSHPSKVFMLSNDQYVGLIGQAKFDKTTIRKLRQVISKGLDNLGHLISPQQVDIQLRMWSVQFVYRDLVQEFNLSALLRDTSPIDKTVNHLIERTKGALKVVNNIYQADAYLRIRNFPAALSEYQVAESHDPHNPYVLRHICECLTEVGFYDEAIRYGNKSVTIDPGYAGSYRRLAEAYVRQGNFDDAVKNYEEALARAGEDPTIYLKMAQALILRAAPNDFERIIENINQAMSYDNELLRSVYLMYKGDACLAYGKYAYAVNWYAQALSLDPDNKNLEWELSKARYKMQSNSAIMNENGDE